MSCKPHGLAALLFSVSIFQQVFPQVPVSSISVHVKSVTKLVWIFTGIFFFMTGMKHIWIWKYACTDTCTHIFVNLRTRWPLGCLHAWSYAERTLWPLVRIPSKVWMFTYVSHSRLSFYSSSHNTSPSPPHSVSCSGLAPHAGNTLTWVKETRLERPIHFGAQ